MVCTISWTSPSWVPGAVELSTIVTVLWSNDHREGVIYSEDGQGKDHGGDEKTLRAGAALANFEEGNPKWKCF